MKRLSLKLRTGMLIVAVVAVALETTILWQRSRRFRSEAEVNAVMEQRCLGFAEESMKTADSIRSRFQDLLRKTRKMREEIDAIDRKYFQKMKADPNLSEKDAQEIADEEASNVRYIAEAEAMFTRDFLEREKRAEERITDAKQSRVWAAWYANLKRKYERAASHLWERVAPDSPEPFPREPLAKSSLPETLSP